MNKTLTLMPALFMALSLACGGVNPKGSTPSSSEWIKSEGAVNDGSWVGSVDPLTNPNNPVGTFELLANQESILISRPEYSLSWNPSTRVVNWASWVLVDGDVGKTNRSGFKIDTELDTFLAARGQKAVDTDEYSGSCLDRGHQVPSKDRTQKFAQNQAVFKMSNMMPQTAFLNRIIWERLEGFTRARLAKAPQNKLWVVTGPIYKGPRRFIGVRKNIAFATANFKIVIDLGASQSSVPKLVAAVIMPNVTSKGTDPLDDRTTACFEERNLPSVADDWTQYSVELGEIEERAGINLEAVRTMLGSTTHTVLRRAAP